MSDILAGSPDPEVVVCQPTQDPLSYDPPVNACKTWRTMPATNTGAVEKGWVCGSG